jgi:outer membrane protein TolC/preprotein translocase subunit SecF
MLSQENHGEKSTRLLADQLITSPVSISATPLRSIATFTPEWSEGNIVRRNGIRTLTIQVNNDTKITASRIFNEIRPQVDALKLPAGTTISYGGEYEGQVEVFIPMTIALGLSIVLIFFIILFQFKKEKLTLLIMLTMLLGFPGAAFGLKLAGYPFSLTAFIGISSICGMVVRNGIILIDYARDLHENKHLTVFESALAAGKRRMRPIFLTSAAASVGVIPMIISRSSLWGPVGTVICFGLLLAMVLTLYVLPVLYSLVYSDRPPRKGFWSLPGSRIILVISLVAGSGQVARSQNTGLSLDSCKSLAMYNNYKIRQAAGEVKQSIQVKKDAFTKYFPNVSAGFMGMKTTDYLVKATTPQMNLPVYDGNPMSLLNPTLFAYVPPISLNLVDYINMGYVMAAQPVFAGGRIYNGNRLARTGLEINQHKESLTKTEVLVKTEELYWNLTSLNEKMATLEAYRLLLDTLNHDVSSALRAGLVQRTDILKVQLKQNELEIKRIQLTDAIALCKMALCLHIGIPCDSNLVLTDKVPDAEDPGYLFVDSESAVKNRNEYHILEKAVRAEELQKKIRLGEYLPRMAVGVAGVYNDMMDKTDEFGIAFATVSVPISDWWGGAHTLKESALKIENAQLRLEETADFLSLQVNHARNDLYEMYFRTAMARKSLDQATENLGVTKANYKAGVASMADLLEAEAVHQEAIDNQIESQCNYHIKKACYLESINQYPTANP